MSEVLTDQSVLGPHHVGRLAGQVPQVEKVVTSPDGARPVTEDGGSPHTPNPPGDPEAVLGRLTVQQSHHPPDVSAEPDLPLAPRVREDEGVQRAGGELSVQHHGLPQAGVHGLVPYHLPHGRQHVGDIPSGELCEVLPVNSLQQGRLLPPPPAQQGGQQARQNLPPETVRAGKGRLVVKVKPRSGLQPLALCGGQQDGPSESNGELDRDLEM